MIVLDSYRQSDGHCSGKRILLSIGTTQFQDPKA